MDNKICSHKDSNGRTTLIFDTKTKRMVYPVKYYGYCSLCKESIELNKNEFEKFNQE